MIARALGVLLIVAALVAAGWELAQAAHRLTGGMP